MRLSVINAPPRLLRKSDAENYVGGEHMLDLFVKAGWVKPAMHGNRYTVFDRHTLDTACYRLSSGEELGPKKSE